MIDVKRLRTDAEVSQGRHMAISKEAVIELLDRLEAAERERDAMAAHVERLHEGLDQALVHWGANVADEDGTAYAECEKRCGESPESSLTRLKAKWQAEVLEDCADYLPQKGVSIGRMHVQEFAATRRQAEEKPHE